MARRKKIAGDGSTTCADQADRAVPSARDLPSAEGQEHAADRAGSNLPDADAGGHGRSADTARRHVSPAHEHEGQSIDADEASLFLPSRDGEAGRDAVADQASMSAPPSPRFSDDPRIKDIRILADERRFWMRLRIENTNRLVAQLRSMLQPGRGQDDEWSSETKTMAKALVDEALAAFVHAKKGAKRERMPKVDHPLLKSSIVEGAIIALAEYEARELAALTVMTTLTSALPVAAFIDDQCRGFSLAGLAVLIGHAGDFRDYPKKGHLWKRLGLAPYAKDGATCAGSTWGKTGGLSADDWTILGYKKSRLGDIFGKITQPLLYAQWRSTGAIGRYGTLYGDYKARQKALNEDGAFAAEAQRQAASLKKHGLRPVTALAEGKLSDAQINMRALRYMTKKLIEHIWKYWRTMGQPVRTDEAVCAVPASAGVEGRAVSHVPHSAAEESLPAHRSRSAKAARQLSGKTIPALSPADPATDGAEFELHQKCQWEIASAAGTTSAASEALRPLPVKACAVVPPAAGGSP